MTRRSDYDARKPDEKEKPSCRLLNPLEDAKASAEIPALAGRVIIDTFVFTFELLLSL